MARINPLPDVPVSSQQRNRPGMLRCCDETSPASNNLVLSLFPGVGLLDSGFELAGFCVVRGPDNLWGGDIRRFCPPSGVFHGVIGGPPCQDFSRVRRSEPTGYGLQMLAEFRRVVLAAAPDWWIMENVPGVPDFHIDGYSWQRIDIKPSEFGLKQSRLRHVQFGHRQGMVLTVPRLEIRESELEPCCMATEGKRQNRRDFSRFCSLQGLPESFDLPPFRESAKYAAVGNGVPVPMAKAIATGIKNLKDNVSVCACGCGREVTGKSRYAIVACRVREHRRRYPAGVSQPGAETGSM